MESRWPLSFLFWPLCGQFRHLRNMALKKEKKTTLFQNASNNAFLKIVFLETIQFHIKLKRCHNRGRGGKGTTICRKNHVSSFRKPSLNYSPLSRLVTFWRIVRTLGRRPATSAAALDISSRIVRTGGEKVMSKMKILNMMKDRVYILVPLLC